MKAKGCDSPLWKAICRVLPQVDTGIGWTIGNGSMVRFWKDEWLDGFGPLI